MASITVNIESAKAGIKSIFDKLTDREYLLRPLAIETIANMKDRIHDQGKASDEAQIGTYSTEYMKVRTGNYGNSGRFTKGENKGKIKNSGVYTRGDKAGQNRPDYGRSSDTKVIVSLTRQLENDWAVLATPNNGYGIGFNNPFNTQKARWVEEQKKKIIFNLTAQERDYIRERAQELVNDAINRG